MVAGAAAVIIILIWMSGSGSRQRFIVLKRTKETDQLSRDINRIADALEKIARQRELPVDYVGRPMGPGWEDSFPAEDSESHDHAEPVPTRFSEADRKAAALASLSAAQKSAMQKKDHEQTSVQDPDSEPVRTGGAKFRSFTEVNPQPSAPDAIPEPSRGKKGLDLPNPLYRPK